VRLFVAVEVPPLEVPGLLRSSAGAPEHLTLKFLGEVPEPRVGEVGRELERALAGASSFPISVEGLGVFPSPGRPRVLWAGIGKGRAELSDLARRTESALAPLGFPSEPRPFVAHVTLRRYSAGSPTSEVRDLLQRHARAVFAQGWVRSVELKQSELSSQGARHTTLLSVPLGPPLS
jgi:RNA 2',3'-cyclic 3'-phosphodiesterase